MLISFTGCASVLGPLKSMIGGGDSIDVDTEIVVGDKDENNEVDVHVGSRNNSTQSAHTISNVNEIPPYVILLLILGWLLPCPSDIWRGFFSLIPWVKKK